MPKSPADYRKEARRLRGLAMEMTAPEIQRALLQVAASYDGLAHAAETLAILNSPEFSPRSN